MRLTTEDYDYFLQLDRIQNIFQNVMKRLFINESLCEQTELHSFLFKQTNQRKYIYYDRELILEDELQYQNAIANRTLVQKYLQDKFIEREYILDEVEIDQKEGSKYKIFLVLLSACLDNHYGKLVLKCFLQQLTEVFNHFLKMPYYENDDELIQDTLDNTEARVVFLLQTLYEPLKLDFVNSLSGEYYEKAECVSNMVFLPYNVVNTLDDNNLVYHFENVDFTPENSRLLRKLLQIAQQNLCLVMGETNNRKSFQVLGICKKDLLKEFPKNKDGMIIPCIRVEMKKHMQWNMFLNENYILTCKNGHYKIERPLEEKYLKKKIAEYFGDRQDDYKDLIKSITQSQNQGHGTMLVIMDEEDAHDEVQRLGFLKYGIMENAPRVQEEINCLNSIDGGVIMDIDGKVHGIGMILDGISFESGSLARGARYNSAIKYCSFLRENKREKQIKAMILIVSEDGPVNIISV